MGVGKLQTGVALGLKTFPGYNGDISGLSLGGVWPDTKMRLTEVAE